MPSVLCVALFCHNRPPPPPKLHLRWRHAATPVWAQSDGADNLMPPFVCDFFCFLFGIF